MLTRFTLLLCLLFTLATSRGAVIISEFVADNTTGLKDEDNEYSDWIELLNDGTTAVNLTGWSLTDDAADDNKWQFPNVTIGPGQFLVVFASGKDRRVAGATLHTNFSLSSSGEYLALRDASGNATSEFTPVFPPQFENKSYGLGQNVVTTQLVAANAAARALVPTSNALGTTWTAAGFNDASWTLGTQGVGFESTVAGFAFRTYFANVGVGTIATANSVIATPSMQAQTFSETRAVVNYCELGSAGRYTPESNPTWANSNADNYVVEATGIMTIPTAGTWTFGVNSDDGFQFQVRAVGATTWSTVCNFDGGRGPSDTLGTHTFATAGDYEVRVMIYEGGGGSAGEAWAKQGSFGGWDSGFRLIGDTANGGLAVRSVPIGSTNGGVQSSIGTDIKAAMSGINATAYARIPFTVADVSQLQTLTLNVKYDDGFVAYVNGVEIARRNAPATPTWNSTATATHPTAQVSVYENMDASAAIPYLVNGTDNVLSFHLLNVAANDTDALVLAELAEYEVTGTEYHFLTTPTPGAANGTQYYAFVEKPVMSVKHGFFSATFPVTLTTTTPGAQIRYTTNGSAPTATTGTVYTGPFNITGTTVLRAAGFAAGFTASPVATETYIFLDQVIVQPSQPAGFPSTGSTYFQMNTSASITNTNPYSATIMKNALKSLPTLSIVTSMDNLFSPSTGIYANSGAEGVAWERPASLEFIDPTGGGNEFYIDCGLRIQGGASRSGGQPKHGLRVLFKEQYGATKLKFPLFAGSPVDEFDTITLHARFNDMFVNNGNAQYLRDMWHSDTQIDMGRVGPHKLFVHLYINGAYWGVYDPGEKGDAAFAASHLGGDKSEYDAFNSDENIDGNRTAWDAMFAIANSGLSSDTAYANIKQYLDVPSFIDYMLLNFYGGNSDWPWHNWNAARRRIAGAGFHFFSWDAEWTFSDVNSNRVGLGDGSPGVLWAALRQNAEFRQLVGDHAQKHCFNGGALTPAVAEARWMARATEIDQPIIAESARWGNATRHGNWIPEQNRLRTSYFPQRTAILVQQRRGISCFPSNNAPTFSQFGGSVPSGYSLVLTNPNGAGTIIYTTDGTDPRLPGGGIAPGAITYSGPLIINASTLFRARVKDGSTWSAIVEVTFYTPQDFTKLVVTEINYNPTNLGAVSGDELEFIELKNIGNVTIDLGGCTFTNGIAYTFPNGTMIAPGAFYVLVRDVTVGQTNFHTRYPGVPVSGVYTGKLDNSGETLTLSAPTGGHIFDVSYNDSLPWPVSADGNGFTAVPKSNIYNSDNGIHWRGSANIFGSPGVNDPSVSPSVVINEILTNSELPLRDTIELHNPTTSSVDVSYWWLTDDPNTPKKYQIPAGSVIPAGGYLYFDETQFNPTPGVGLTSFALNDTGDDVFVFSGDAGGNLTGYIHGFAFGGDEYFPRQISRTFGALNSGPLVGPLVINEIMYHPYAGYDEFIEIRNISNAAVPLYDPVNPTNTWKINGVSYTFPVGQSIPAGGYALITGIAPATFRTKYNVPGSVQIFGPFAGVLQDNGEHITIEMPDTPYLNTLGQTVVPYVVIDGVHYSNIAPWSLIADGSGPSLQRLNSSAYADEAANWFTDGITGGFPNAANIPSNITITSPAHNSPYTAPSTVTFPSSVTDADGTVIKVEYYSGVIKLGESTTGPNYSFAWTSTPGTHTVTAKATDNSLGVSISAPITVYVTPTITQGLKGDYYANKTLTAPIVGTRTDAFSSTNTIDFSTASIPVWPTNLGFPNLTTTTNFSVRWSGQVRATVTGNYTFTTNNTNDGARLFVNGIQIINNWNNVADNTTQSATSSQIALTAGQLYDIVLEYYQDTGNGSINLKWRPGLGFTANIPQSVLYPDSVPIIVNHPVAVSKDQGESATFTALSSGKNLTCQWRKNGVFIPGATSQTYTIPYLTPGDAAQYSVFVSNSYGFAISNNAQLNVTYTDTDADGIQNYWETANGMNPNSAADASLDTDGDGYTNLQEFLAGTNPNNANSKFAVTIATANSGPGYTLTFIAMPYKSYTIQYKDSLTAASWTTLQSYPSTTSQQTITYTDPTGTGTRFYRVATP